MQRPIRLAVVLLLVSVGLGAEAQDGGIHPALQEMGTISVNNECREGPRAPGPPEAFSAAIGVVVRTDGDWQKAAPMLEAVAHKPRFADCRSQQYVASVALQAVLLGAPPEADGAIEKHLHRLIESDGNSFVAMVEALDRVRDDLPPPTVRVYEQTIAARYDERFDPDCSRCTPAEAEQRRRIEAAEDDGPSIFDRMSPEVRARAERAIARHVAARERIQSWDG